MYDKKWLIAYNKNKNIKEYNELQLYFDPNYNKCKCGQPIFYSDSTFTITNVIKYKNKSYQTYKILFNQKYYLCVCEKCLMLKFNYKPNTRVFNLLSDITCYAFNIPENIKNTWTKQNYIQTKDNFILKYGEALGEEKWNNYKSKQTISNSYEYKKDRYNWTKEEYDNYNKSRAITINNLTKKYGSILALEKYENYINKERYSCTKEYFTEKYGDIGEEKYNNFVINKSFKTVAYSNISQKLFRELDTYLSSYTTYFATKNSEYYLSYSNNFYYLDYYIKELNVAVEFYGDVFHANPKKFKPNDNPNPFNKNLTATDIWNNDEIRIQNILTNFNITTIIVWESDYNSNIILDLINQITQ